ncbi:MAG: ABC transporter substrate-binding protein [Myxococcales bacterium]
MTTKVSLRRAAIPAALSLVLLGCGESKHEDSDEIRIGLLLPYTGKDGSAGGNYERGVLMAVDRINAAGGLHDKPVRILYGDTHSSVERGLASAQELADRGVVAIIGPESDELARALPPVLSEAGVALLTPSSSSVPVGSSQDLDMWFRLAPSSKDLASALARKMKVDGAQRVAIISTDAEYEASFASGIEERLGAIAVSVAASTKISASTTDFSAAIAAVVAASPDAIVLAADATTASKFVNDFSFKSGKHDLQWYLSPSLEQPGFLLNASTDALEGMVGVAPAVSPDGARTDGFTEAFVKRWKGSKPTTGAFYYYDAVALFAVAYEAAPVLEGELLPDAQSVRDHVLSSSGQSGVVFEWDELQKGIANARDGKAVYYSGVTGVIALDRSGGRSAAYTRFWTIERGQFVALK